MVWHHTKKKTTQTNTDTDIMPRKVISKKTRTAPVAFSPVKDPNCSTPRDRKNLHASARRGSPKQPPPPPRVPQAKRRAASLFATTGYAPPTLEAPDWTHEDEE